jgi:hypothetical protein
LPVRVVLDGPPRFGIGRAIGRAVLAGIGGVLVALALIGVWPMIGLTFLFGARIFGQKLEEDGSDPPVWLTDRLWLTWLVVTVGTILCYRIGMRLVRGRRRTVLFLRRFGFNDATNVMTGVVRHIGGYWRIVTLDDAQIEALGYSEEAERRFKRFDKIMKGLGALSVWVLRALAYAAIAAAAIYAFVLWRRHQDGQDVEVDFDAIEKVIIGGLIIAGVVMAGLLLRLVFAPFFAMASSARESVVKAEGSKQVVITNSMQLPLVSQTVQQQTRKVISPKLIVLKVATPVWQQTVSTFAASTTLSLIDVSMVSENVLWEIDHLQQELGGRCVYVGERDRLATLSTVPPPGSVEEEVQQRLDGISVLAYTTDPKGVRRFTRALRATLEDRAERADR